MAQDFMVKIGASMDVSQVEDAIKKLGASLGQLKVDPKATTDLTKGLEKLKQQVETFKAKSKNVTDEKDMSELLSLAKGITRTYDSLIAKIKVMSNLSGEAAKKLFPPDTAVKIKAAAKALEDYRDKIAAAEKLVTKQQDRIDNLNTRLEESAKAAGLTVDEFKNIEKAIEDARKEVEKYNEELEEAKKAPKASDGRTKEGRRVKELTEKRDAAQGKLEGLESNKGSISKQAEEYARKIADAEVRLRALQKAVIDLNAAGGNKLKELTDDLKTITGLDLEGKSLEQITTALEEMGKTDLANLVASLQQAGQTAGEAAPSMGKFAEEAKDAADKTKEFDKQAGELSSLKSRIAYFFGAQNAINLFKKAIRSAFNSVKELDEIMTQTAVVTKFDVSDMWDQLPEYTARANALGVAISDAYKSATLFYQQGLKTNEVIEVSNQTLKMARIAGLDAADATDKMTAALRGFNMEVNGTNAERISDVYSKLAAITASNVQEISTAMTKTASLASNAGMQFETTAAFLSQIIETTRESAETAGTALKTVIARFQELKKSPDEIGEVDGEIIDANKIEGALRTVGVALRDTSGQFRDLDQVFMELASKWDSLDTNTQRYIATIAAGSRQQSRFIAMMSDYKRTTELVEAANNAAGASTQQYEKTLESMQTVLNRLKNAWNEFTMGIANSSILKGALKVLTGIINAINNLTKVFGSTIGGFAKLGIAIGGLKAGGKIFDALTLSFKKFRKDGVGPATAAMKSFGDLFSKGFSKIGNIINKSGLQKAINNLGKQLEGEKITTEEYGLALRKLGEGIGKDSDQYLAYTAAVEAGLTPKEASVFLTNSQAAALAKEKIGTEESTAETYKKIIADQTENKVQFSGLKVLWARIVATAGFTQTQRLTAALKLKNITLTGKETVADLKALAAQNGLNASMLACPIFWIIAGLAALIALIVIFVNVANKASKAAKLEKLNKTIGQLNDQIDEVRDSISDIKDQKAELESMYETFSHLAKGSTEWKEQLVEINTKVMDLIAKYPELARYFTRGESGALEIEDEGWDVLLQNQQQQLSALVNARISAQARVEELRRDIDTESLFKKKLGSKDINYLTRRAIQADEDGTAVKGLTEEQFNELTLRMANAGLSFESSEAELKAVFEKYKDYLGEEAQGWDWEKTYGVIGNLGEDFDTLGTKVQASSKAVDEYTKAFVSNIVDTTVGANSDLKDQLVNVASIQNNTMMSELNKKVEEYNKENRGNKANGDQEKDTVDEYKKITGKTDTRKTIIKDVGWEEINRVVLTNKKEKELSEYIKKLEQNLNTVKGKEGGKAFLNLLTEDGKKLTKKDLQELKEKGISSTSTTEEIKAALDKMGIAWEELELPLETITRDAETAADAFEKADQKLEKLGYTGNKVEGDLTAEGYVGINNQLAHIITAGGNASDLADQFSNIYGQVNTEDRNTFLSIINGMDWKNATAWENLVDTLNESGVKITQQLSKDLKEFAKAGIIAADAIHKIDFEKLTQNTQAAIKVANDIKTGSQGRTFDSSTYEALVAANKDLTRQFQLTLSGDYVYLGSSMEELQSAIEDNTQAILDDANAQLLSRYEFSKKILSEVGFNAGELDDMSELELQNLLSEIVIRSTYEGIDLGKVGVAGLDNGTEAYKIDDINELRNIFSGIAQINWGENEKQYKEYLHTSSTLAYQNSSAAFNASRSYYLGGEGSKLTGNDKEAYEAELQDRRNALYTQAALAGIRQDWLEEYRKAIEAGEDSTELERKIANEIEKIYSNDKIQQYLQNVKDLTIQYETIEDEQTKIIKANEMLAAFGVSVNTKEDADYYADLVYKVTQGNMEAYYELIDKVLNDATDMDAAAEKLVNSGMMISSVNEQGEITQRALTKDELNTNVGLAGTKEEWENPYDYLTNINEEINGLIRQRTRLENEYQKIIKSANISSEELTQNLSNQLAILQEQKDIQVEKAKKTAEETQKLIDENERFNDLVSYDSQTGAIKVDFEAAEELFKDNPKEGKEFEKYIEELTKLRDQSKEAEDDLNDILKSVEDIKNTGKEQYMNLEQSVFDALVQKQEEEIDHLDSINSSINDANSKLIDSLQSNIDKMRQDRANEKAESDIEDKQRRLDYLMMDTSGANALEIIKLQDEITNAQESYTDSLIDQSIQQLQDQNQIAQEQREEQIELMRNQLEYAQQNGTLWSEVEDIIRDGLSSLNIQDTQLFDLLSNKENWQAMSDLQKQAFGEELTSNLSLAEVWLSGELQSLVEGDGEETGIKGEINAALETVTDTFNTATAKLPKITEIKDTTTQITTSATEAISTNITNAFDKVQAAISNLKTKIANGKVAGAGGTGPTDKSAQEAAISAQKASAQKAVNTQKAISALGSGGSIEDAWNQYENLSAEEKELLSQEDINKLDEYHKAYERIEKTTMEVKSGFNWSEARKEEEWGLIKNGEGRELEVAVDGSQGLNNDLAKQAVKAGVKDGEIFQDKNAEKPAWYILDIPSSNPNEPNALQILKDWVSDRSGYNWWKFHPAHFSKFNGTDSTYQKTTYNELINNENLKGMKYKSGGYADYTGFAWLDGTPSHPEAVLNASDTERFIALIDTLRSLEADGAGSSGDNYFDINIEVGSVSGDYDVERMADKIKEIIVNDAAYRNVNSINLIQ